MWVYCELDKCPQYELTMTHAGWAFCDFHVSSQWVSCELKFFTGRIFQKKVEFLPKKAMNVIFYVHRYFFAHNYTS